MNTEPGDDLAAIFCDSFFPRLGLLGRSEMKKIATLAPGRQCLERGSEFSVEIELPLEFKRDFRVGLWKAVRSLRLCFEKNRLGDESL